MDNLVDPNEPVEVQLARLHKISTVLMRRVETQTDRDGAAYSQFERAVVLEDQVRRRTEELEHALRLLNESNARLSAANQEIESARRDLSSAIEAVQEGFALFGVDDVLLLFNGRFCWQMPDVRERLRPGLSFAEYIRIVSRSPMLELPAGMTPETWAAMRMQRHRRDHLIFNLSLSDDRWLQISEHRTANSGTAIVQTDVTELMRAEREQRERLLDNQGRIVRATLDHLAQGVAIFDAQGLLAGWNRRFRILTGLPPQTFALGTRFSRVTEQLQQLFRPADADAEARIAGWLGDRAAQRSLSFELLQRDTGLTLDAFAQRLPDDGFVLSLTDVTAERDALRRLARANEELEARVAARTDELRDALARAERSNASKSRFVAAASHDLLQPLSAARLYLSAADAAGTNTNVQKAGEALNNVERIIEALADISRLETEEELTEPSELALNDILSSLASSFAPGAAAKGLRFRVRPTTAHVVSDGLYLQRILQNLISNAIRYTERGGVLVGARRRDEQIRIEVWDSGPGIREEDRSVIFEEFRRLHRRASASEGMGLGLAIVERACARLGHRLELLSHPGQGSLFRITLPLAQEPAHPLALDSAGGDPRHLPSMAGRGLLVLLVDNDAELRRAMVALLEGWGITVLDAHGPDDAIALIDEMDFVPDAMLIDYQLDDNADGLDLVAMLRRRFGWRPTRIISADRAPGLRERCARMGLHAMPKPLDTEALYHFLSNVCPAGG
ncbi:signal transduction histidine kinase [Paracoccus alcaliphilus]|uniref:histidine kinase n=1 Tax=Paracoccus alcaliphilus TaxID=34002 RepID=A0A1H8J9R0_9RHOB|nr:PAS-domain containing protein [Paracoccus alcaliphilus]SEN77341.1 signal transduction histidine kinase [Paracoccus alcaliphilus]